MSFRYYECMLDIAAAYNAHYGLAPTGYLAEYRYYLAIVREA